MKRIVDFVHQHNSLAGLQLSHAGRKVLNSWLLNDIPHLHTNFKSFEKASTSPPHDTFALQREALQDQQGGWEPVGPTQVGVNLCETLRCTSLLSHFAHHNRNLIAVKQDFLTS